MDREGGLGSSGRGAQTTASEDEETKGAKGAMGRLVGFEEEDVVCLCQMQPARQVGVEGGAPGFGSLGVTNKGNWTALIGWGLGACFGEDVGESVG